MKKAAKKAAKAKPKAKTAVKKAKSPAKAVKKTKAAPKKKAAAPKAKAVAKKSPAKAKPAVKAPAKKAAQKKLASLDLPKGTTSIEVRQDNSRKSPSIVITPVTKPAASAPSSGPVLSSSGRGTPQSPWLLKTPAGFSEFQAYREEAATPPALVVKVGSTELRYDLRCINDLYEMLKAHGDWKLLGSADEQQPVVEDTVESWARSPSNPVGGFYGLSAGLRGRFATYVPQVLEALGLAEVEHFPNNNRMRAK